MCYPCSSSFSSHGQSLAALFGRAIHIRHCAVHRRPQIPVKKVEDMVRNAWLLSRALQDDLRATQLLHWHKALENLIAHLQAAGADLRNIHNAKIETERRLAELESKASQLTLSLEVEGRTHQPIDIEALPSLEEALSSPNLARIPLIISLDQAWRWVGNSVGMLIVKNVGWSHPQRDS